MKLLPHLSIADVRRHRLLLLAWLLVVGLSAAVDGLLPVVDLDPATRQSLGPIRSLWWLTETLLFTLVTAMVIQTHPAVGSRAFWMTRPIPPDTLLASKAVLLAAAVIALPAAVQAVVMTFYRVPSGDLIAVTVESALDACWWLALLAIFAALTPTLARFALGLGGALLAVAATLSIALAISSFVGTDDFRPQRSQSVHDPTADFVMTILMITAGAATLAVQYRRRSRPRSVLIGITGVTIASLAASVWPWSLLAPQLTVPAWAEGDRPRLVIAPESIDALRVRTEGPRGSSWRSIRGRVYLEGLPPDTSAFVNLLEGTLRIDGRPTLVSGRAGQFAVPADAGEEQPETRAARSVLGVERLVDGRNTRGESPVIMTMPDQAFQELAPAVGVYRGRFEVVATEHAIEAVLPLRVGAAHQNGPYRVVIESISHGPAVLRMEVRQSNAVTSFDRSVPAQRSFYLRNQERSEAVFGPTDMYRAVSFGLLPIWIARSGGSGFWAQRLQLVFSPPYMPDGGELTLDERWLDDAEFVIVAATQQRAFERTLEVESFPLRLAPPGDPNR